MKEKPTINRLLSGIFIWETGLDGAFPHCYQLSMGGNPYVDDANKKNTIFRPHMTTYPSKEGPIPTIQWEAMREGIDDMRYLMTLGNLFSRAKEKPSSELLDAEIKKTTNLLQNIPLKFGGSLPWLFKNLRSQDFYDLRWKVTERIIALHKLLES